MIPLLRPSPSMQMEQNLARAHTTAPHASGNSLQEEEGFIVRNGGSPCHIPTSAPLRWNGSSSVARDDSVGGRQVGTNLAIRLLGKPTLPFIVRQVASEPSTGLVSQIVRTPEPKRRGAFVVPG